MKKILFLVVLIPTFAFGIQKIPGTQIDVIHNSEKVNLQSYVDNINNTISGIPSAISNIVNQTEYAITQYECVDLPENSYEINLLDGNEQAFTGYDINNKTYELILPQANFDLVGHLIIYVTELPDNNFYYDIRNDNIALSSYPPGKPWIHTQNNSTWKFEFESIIGSTKWYCVKVTEYVTE